ncbi:copper resistance CopC family protein [Microbacterium sp. 1P10UB]|uniref:copper resistance CopC family protein n=1 Tax=unclassified Microbacterium TaxID=2609290 RepID=UPI0039A27536
MPHRSPARRPRLLAVAAALLVLTGMVGGVLVAAPASAHDELVSTDPAAGATLDAAPEQLTLTFSGELLADPGATEVQITDAAGTSLVSGAPAVAGTTVTQAVDTAAASAGGAVTVLWRVVSSDGHPISGELDFTVAAAAPAPSPTASASATAAASPAPSATEGVEAAPAPSATTVDAVGDSEGTPAWPWVVGGIVLVAAVGALVAVLVGRARGQSPTSR